MIASLLRLAATLKKCGVELEDLYLPGDDFAKLIDTEYTRVTDILKGIGLVQ